MDNFAQFLNQKVFKKAALFLTELSNDNPFCHQALLKPDLEKFLLEFNVNSENVDFYWTML